VASRIGFAHVSSLSARKVAGKFLVSRITGHLVWGPNSTSLFHMKLSFSTAESKGLGCEPRDDIRTQTANLAWHFF